MKGCIIFGGSFNPVHIGHLRLAMEVFWLLGNYAGQLDFVPAAVHPQKNAALLLPLSMRMEMIEISIKDLPGLACSGIEGERKGISYTIDTLKYYLRKWQSAELFFLLGSQDYALMRSWHKWQELTRMCNFAVVPRGQFSFSDFAEITGQLEPDRRHEKIPMPELTEKYPEAGCLTLTEQTCAYYLPVPWLPISSSHIRQLWRQDRNPEWLMPPAALNILRKHINLVNSCWNEKDESC